MKLILVGYKKHFIKRKKRLARNLTNLGIEKNDMELNGANIDQNNFELNRYFTKMITFKDAMR